MGQVQVYGFLKNNKGKWFTSEEIQNKINISLNSVRTSLKRLRDSNEIYFIEKKERKKSYRYMVK